MTVFFAVSLVVPLAASFAVLWTVSVGVSMALWSVFFDVHRKRQTKVVSLAVSLAVL